MITDLSYFKNPAQHLNNIFINRSQQKKSKHKRRNNFPANDSDSTLTGIVSSHSEDDAGEIIFQKQKKGIVSQCKDTANNKLKEDIKGFFDKFKFDSIFYIFEFKEDSASENNPLFAIFQAYSKRFRGNTDYIIKCF